MSRLPRLVSVLVLTCMCAVGLVLAQEEPELPPGLGDEPALPPGLGDEAEDDQDEEQPKTLADRLPRGLHGFWEVRAGPRLRDDDAHSETFTLAETRLRIDYETAWRQAVFDLEGDFLADGVTDEWVYQQRQARMTLRLGRSVDLRLGRQVLTWGTGDLLFINDLFPKDWRSFLSGRDEDYLKSPSDSVRIGWYHRRLNVEVVYTPEFEPDLFVRGERISFWNPATEAFAGDDSQIAASTPGKILDDDEIAVRLYRKLRSYELAVYGYDGFWKSPGGSDPVSMRVTFPRLGVYGASLRGPVGPGIGNVEVGYYNSRDDGDGSDPFVNNDELRFLAGYEMELARELTGGFQYYVERLLDYGRYRSGLAFGEPRDEDRHVVTARLTRLLRNQTLTLSLFAFVGLSDRDAYLLPKVTYDIGDHWSVEAGANWFGGKDDFTFFGQFRNSSNVYAAVRFSI